MSEVRVLITGSRDYAERYNNLLANAKPTPAEATVAKDLDLKDLRKAWGYFMQAVKFAETKGCKRIVFITGACPRGFDKICSEWIANFKNAPIEIIEEQHPADWVQHGPKAGPMRNTDMVNSNPDVFIAGWDGDTANYGTFDCLQKAVKAGVSGRICSSEV